MKTGTIIMAAVAVLLCAPPTSAGGDTECPSSSSGSYFGHNPFNFDLPYFGLGNKWPDSGYTSSSASSSSEYSIPMDDPFWNEILLLGSEDLLIDYLNIVEYGNWYNKEKFFEKHKSKFQALEEKLRNLIYFGRSENHDSSKRKDMLDDARQSWNEIKYLASSEKIDDQDFLIACRETVFHEGRQFGYTRGTNEYYSEVVSDVLNPPNSLGRLSSAGYSNDEINYIFGQTYVTSSEEKAIQDKLEAMK